MHFCIECAYAIGWEEVANAATHLLGFVGMTIGLILFSIKIRRHPRRWRYWGPCLVFTITLGTMYLASVTYHTAAPSWKHRALVLDHFGILLALGGTATAYAMLCKPHFGWPHYALIWFGVAVAMSIVVAERQHDRIVVLLAVVLAAAFLIHMSRRPCPGIRWIWAGVAIYLAGLPFLAATNVPFAHACWHVFVLLGTTAHYIALRKATEKQSPIPQKQPARRHAGFSEGVHSGA